MRFDKADSFLMHVFLENCWPICNQQVLIWLHGSKDLNPFWFKIWKTDLFQFLESEDYMLQQNDDLMNTFLNNVEGCEGWFLSLGYWVGQSDEKKTPLRGRDRLRSDPSVLPVFQISVSWCSWDSHGTSPNLWIQKKLVKFWKSTQDTWLCFAKFLREFLGYSPLDLLGDLGDVILS